MRELDLASRDVISDEFMPTARESRELATAVRKALANILRDAREEQGLSRELAAKQIGVGTATLERAENRRGARNAIDLDLVFQASRVYRTPVLLRAVNEVGLW